MVNTSGEGRIHGLKRETGALGERFESVEALMKDVLAKRAVHSVPTGRHTQGRC